MICTTAGELMYYVSAKANRTILDNVKHNILLVIQMGGNSISFNKGEQTKN